MPSLVFPMECYCERCGKLMVDHPETLAELEYGSPFQRRLVMTDEKLRCYCKPIGGKQADMFGEEKS